MALKDILVHLDESRTNAARLDTALGLARDHGAHLTGLFVAPGLVLLGQHDPDDDASIHTGVVGDVILQCGRPVLMIPYIGLARPFAELVTVAWNAGREAARAVNDALPLLGRAQEVTVLAINPESGDDPIIESADICLHLARHGVKAHAQFAVATDVAVGDMLLSRAHDAGAGLIVMGAYGPRGCARPCSAARPAICSRT